MSRRVNEALGGFSPQAEVYSIDETFLDLGGLGDRDLWAYAQDMRATVRRWTGIPTKQPRPGGVSRPGRFGGWPSRAVARRTTVVR